jgi:ribonuclease PH
VALHDAVSHLMTADAIAAYPLRGHVASVSVGVFEGRPVLDLDYAEDSSAETDMNVVMDDRGRFIEIQGTAEGEPFTAEELNAMLDLARQGIGQLVDYQRRAIAGK